MIQRVQTLFLLGVVILMITSLFFPVWTQVSSQPAQKIEVNAYAMTQSDVAATETVIKKKDIYYIAILSIAVCVVALFSIFQYKKRLNQLKLGLLNSLIMAGLLVALALFSKQADGWLPGEGDFKPGFFCLIAAMFCNLISNRFIKKDEDLVRSADRLR